MGRNSSLHPPQEALGISTRRGSGRFFSTPRAPDRQRRLRAGRGYYFNAAARGAHTFRRQSRGWSGAGLRKQSAPLPSPVPAAFRIFMPFPRRLAYHITPKRKFMMIFYALRLSFAAAQPTAERRPPTAERRPPTANRQPPDADRRPPTAERRTPTANRQTPNANRRPPTAERQPPTVKKRFPFGKRLLALFSFISPEARSCRVRQARESAGAARSVPPARPSSSPRGSLKAQAPSQGGQWFQRRTPQWSCFPR